MERLVVAIDQSTGASSAVGLAILTDDLTVIDSAAFMPKQRYRVAEKRIVCLHEQITQYVSKYITFAVESQMRIEVVFERTVMASKAGELLAESVGAFCTAFPNNELISFHKVSNTAMKRIISGSGKGDKVAVAKGLLNHLPKSEHDLIIKLLNGQSYDTLDAIAIGTTHIKEGA